MLGLGFAFGVLPRARPTRGVIIPLAALGLLAVWTAISLGWTQSDERTFVELNRFLHFAGVLLLIWALVDRDTWKAAAAGLFAAAVAVCILAVLSRLQPSWFPPNYVRNAFQTKRLSYPFNYWNAVGCWASMSTVIALAWSAHLRSWLARCTCLAVVPWCTAAVYLSYSRAGLVGLAVGLLVMFVMGRNRWATLAHAVAAGAGTAIVVAAIHPHEGIAIGSGTGGAWVVLLSLIGASAICAGSAALTRVAKADERWRLPRRTGRIAAAVSVLVVLIVIPTTAHGTLSARWHEFRHDRVSVTTATNPASRFGHLNGNRYFIWRSAWQAFEHHPFKGVGAGTFEFWWSQRGGAEFLRDAHSLYLEQLGEQGIFGGLLILVLIGGLGWLVIKARLRAARAGPAELGIVVGLAAAFAGYAVQAGVDWMWESTAVTVLGLSAAAIGAASMSERAAGAARLALRIPVAVVAALFVLLQIPPLASTTRIQQSQAAFDDGDTASALSRATDAIKAEPWAASPYVQRALVEESLNQLDAARADLLRAQSREPTNWRQPLLLARVETERGDVPAAERAFAEAKRLRPASSFVNPSE